MKGGPKSAVEFAVAIRDYLEGEAVFAEPRVEEDVRKLGGRAVCSCWDDTDIGVEAICEGRDCIVALVFGKGADKVDGDAIAALVRDG